MTYTKEVNVGWVAYTKDPINLAGWIDGGSYGDGKAVAICKEQGWQSFPTSKGGTVFIKDEIMEYGDGEYIARESMDEYIIDAGETLFGKDMVDGVDYYVGCDVPDEISGQHFSSVDDMIKAAAAADWDSILD